MCKKKPCGKTSCKKCQTPLNTFVAEYMVFHFSISGTDNRRETITPPKHSHGKNSRRLFIINSTTDHGNQNKIERALQQFTLVTGTGHGLHRLVIIGSKEPFLNKQESPYSKNSDVEVL